MKLLISVINRDDTYALTDALMKEGYGATIINTTGGFLREGNATLLIGVEDDSVVPVLEIIRANCRNRTKYVDSLPSIVEGEGTPAFNPIEIRVGGAVVFMAHVDQFVRF